MLFIKLPSPRYQPNHNSAVGNAAFVESTIKELVSVCFVVESTTCPIVCSPLSIVVNASGKQHLVLDLRYVNQFLPDQKFKYEGLDLVLLLFRCCDFFTTFDLKPGYHHVHVHEDCWSFLAFLGAMAALSNFFLC